MKPLHRIYQGEEIDALGLGISDLITAEVLYEDSRPRPIVTLQLKYRGGGSMDTLSSLSKFRDDDGGLAPVSVQVYCAPGNTYQPSDFRARQDDVFGAIRNENILRAVDELRTNFKKSSEE